VYRICGGWPENQGLIPCRADISSSPVHGNQLWSPASLLYPTEGTRSSFHGNEAAWHNADHLPPSSRTKVKNAQCYTSTPLHTSLSWCLIEQRVNYTLDGSSFFLKRCMKNCTTMKRDLFHSAGSSCIHNHLPLTQIRYHPSVHCEKVSNVINYYSETNWSTEEISHSSLNFRKISNSCLELKVILTHAY
jgi:hypothetical protein